MIYAATFADYKLLWPATFLRRLIDQGVAGNATSIGTDYPMLERAGIVKVVDGSGWGRKRLKLLQSDVAEDALKILETRSQSGDGNDDVAAIGGQRAYTHIDRSRAKIASETGYDEREEARLIAALREESVRRTVAGS